jgi:hypothetical protein
MAARPVPMHQCFRFIRKENAVFYLHIFTRRTIQQAIDFPFFISAKRYGSTPYQLSGIFSSFCRVAAQVNVMDQKCSKF